MDIPFVLQLYDLQPALRHFKIQPSRLLKVTHSLHGLVWCCILHNTVVFRLCALSIRLVGLGGGGATLGNVSPF